MFLKKPLAYLLTASIVVSIGTMSFAGMLLFSPTLILPALAFFFAGFVEGEVYKQNIFKGLDELKLIGPHARKYFLLHELKKFTKNPPNENDCQFLQEYFNQKKYVQAFKNKQLTAEQKILQIKAKKRLQRMEKFFVMKVLSADAEFSYGDDDKDNQKFQQLLQHFQHKINPLQQKIHFLRASIPINILAGIGSGFATAFTMQSTLLTLGVKFAFTLSAPLFATLIWPVAIIAAVGYSFLIYHSICDMVHNDVLSKWRKKLVSWFSRQENETNLHYGLRAAGIALLATFVICLGIAATLATAGTWWFAVKKGAMLLPYLASAAIAIRNVLVPIVGTTQLLFTLKNSLDTVKSLLKISNPLISIKNKLIELNKNENIVQLFNPFRLITAPILNVFDYISFAGHLIAVGAIANRVGSIPPVITTGISGLSDGLQDLHRFLPEENSANKHEDHQHSKLPEMALKLVLSPLLFLAALWDFGFSKFNTEKPELTFKQAFGKHFGIAFHDKTFSTPAMTPSTEWLKNEIEYRFAKHEKKLNSVLISKKIAANKIANLNHFKQQALNEIKSDFSEIKHVQTEKTINQHRFFSTKSPNRSKFIDKICADYHLTNSISP